MGGAAFCALVAAALVYAKDLGSRILHPPTNLSIGLENHTHVALYWNFTEPDFINLEDVTFELALEDGTDSVGRHRLRASTRPFHYILKDLKPDTEYNLRIWATHPNMRDSRVIEESFITLAGDWPIPLITSVTPVRSENALGYSVGWSLAYYPDYLSHFEIVACSFGCETVRARFSDSKVTVPVHFFTKFTLTVSAFYDEPVIGLIKRESTIFDGFSEMGTPSKVEHMKRIRQIGNEFRIEWIRPRPPNGPLSYYEVILYDPLNPLSVSWVNATAGPKASLMAPPVRGDLYKIKIRAVNVDFNGTEYKGEFAIFDYERSDLPKPIDVEVLRRKPNLVHFKVIPAHLQENIIFDVESQVQLRRVYNRPDEIEAISLKPFQTFSISARLCYATKQPGTHTCGGFSHFELTSNVDKPSEVLDLEVTLSAAKIIVVTWNRPLTSNGPIEGYNILVQHSVAYSLETVSYMFVSRVNWLQFPKPKEWLSFKIGVAAININLNDNQTEVAGPMVFGEVAEPLTGIAKYYLIAAGVTILLVLLNICLDCDNYANLSARLRLHNRQLLEVANHERGQALVNLARAQVLDDAQGVREHAL